MWTAGIKLKLHCLSRKENTVWVFFSDKSENKIKDQGKACAENGMSGVNSSPFNSLVKLLGTLIII